MSQSNTVSIENHQSIIRSIVKYQNIAISIAKIVKYCNKYFKKVKVLY